MIAWLSAIGPSPGTTSTGILPFALMARNSGVRVSPAMIVRVTRGDEILLAHEACDPLTAHSLAVVDGEIGPVEQRVQAVGQLGVA